MGSTACLSWEKPGDTAAPDRQPGRFFDFMLKEPFTGRASDAQPRRSTISFLISAIALAGFRPLGQVRVQFMMVWQR